MLGSLSRPFTGVITGHRHIYLCLLTFHCLSLIWIYQVIQKQPFEQGYQNRLAGWEDPTACLLVKKVIDSSRSKATLHSKRCLLQ